MVTKHAERHRANRKNGAWRDEDVVASLGHHMAMIVKLTHETVTHVHTEVFTHCSPQPLWWVHGLEAARCSAQLLSRTFMSKKKKQEKRQRRIINNKIILVESYIQVNLVVIKKSTWLDTYWICHHCNGRNPPTEAWQKGDTSHCLLILSAQASANDIKGAPRTVIALYNTREGWRAALTGLRPLRPYPGREVAWELEEFGSMWKWNSRQINL